MVTQLLTELILIEGEIEALEQELGNNVNSPVGERLFGLRIKRDNLKVALKKEAKRKRQNERRQLR